MFFRIFKISLPIKLWISVRYLLMTKIKSLCVDNVKILKNQTKFKNDFLIQKVKNITLPYGCTAIKVVLDFTSVQRNSRIMVSDFKFYDKENKKIIIFNADIDMEFLTIEKSNESLYIEANCLYHNSCPVMIKGTPSLEMILISKFPNDDLKIDSIIDEVKLILKQDLNEFIKNSKGKDIFIMKNMDYIAYQLNRYDKKIIFKKKHLLDNRIHLNSNNLEIKDLEDIIQDINQIKIL